MQQVYRSKHHDQFILDYSLELLLSSLDLDFLALLPRKPAFLLLTCLPLTRGQQVCADAGALQNLDAHDVERDLKFMNVGVLDNWLQPKKRMISCSSPHWMLIASLLQMVMAGP